MRFRVRALQVHAEPLVRVLGVGRRARVWGLNAPYHLPRPLALPGL
jgi:hypothetical protein